MLYVYAILESLAIWLYQSCLTACTGVAATALASLHLIVCEKQKGICLCAYTRGQVHVCTQQQCSMDPCCRLSGYHMMDQLWLGCLSRPMAMLPQPDSITPQPLLMVRPSEHLCVHSCIKHVHAWDVGMHAQHGVLHVLATRYHTVTWNRWPCELRNTF